jgi:endonuclease/exonuclease/phosphatase family metal-dependent hydrolase
MTWNVAGRVRTVEAQAAAVAALAPDVIALQEIRAAAADIWRELLAGHGYPHSLVILEGPTPREPQRRLGVMIAARDPLVAVPVPPVPWPERLVAARVTLAGKPLVLYNLHAPTSAREDEVKVRTLEAVAAHLAHDDGAPTALVGDLNTPQYESREGEVRSFARTRAGNIRPSHGERHDRAELAIVPGLAGSGFTDAFRACHGYTARDRSWMYPNRRMGYRLDHIFIRHVGVAACAYEHSVRERGLSDHSALCAELKWS